MNTKICKDCKIEKPVNDFAKRSSSKDGLQTYCKPCQNQRVYKVPSFKSNVRKGQLKSKYGIRPEDYDFLFAIQKGRCAICKMAEEGTREFLCVDHSHDTGKVRGLLCHKCNLGLGKFQDNVEYLSNAIEYLNKNIT